MNPPIRRGEEQSSCNPNILVGKYYLVLQNQGWSSTGPCLPLGVVSRMLFSKVLT